MSEEEVKREEPEVQDKKKSKKHKKDKKPKAAAPQEAAADTDRKSRDKKHKKDKKRKSDQISDPVEEEEKPLNKTNKKVEQQEQAPETADVEMTEAVVEGKFDENAKVLADPTEFWKTNDIVVKGGDFDSSTIKGRAEIPVWAAPLNKFSDSGLNAALLESTKNFEKPTPIQSQCIPILLTGKDTVGIAKTGSGKTLAFGLPGLQVVLNAQAQTKGKVGPKVLVLAPTRELAIQSFDVLKSAAQVSGKKINVCCIYGGVPMKEQVDSLKGRKCEVIIATPGRLLAHLNDLGAEACGFGNISYFVLDEADRMLDMGFIPDVRRIRECLNLKQIQTVMFSATWPDIVRKLASEMLSPNCVEVFVGSACKQATANTDVEQKVMVIEDRQKSWELFNVLKQHPSAKKIIVFVLYKKEAPYVQGQMEKRNFKVDSITGDKTQAARESALENFKSGKVNVLIATDVAARGLDIPNVDLVINFTFPLTIEDYVHRIGRTGRAGRKGIAVTFFTPQNKGFAGELANVMRKAGAQVPEELTRFGGAVKKREHALYGAHYKSSDEPLPKATHVKF